MKENAQGLPNDSSTASLEAIFLKDKATFFLSVIQSIKATFTSCLQGYDTALCNKFIQQMTFYERRCQELLREKKDVFKITHVQHGMQRDRYGSDAEENEALTRIIKNFHNPIESFFERCNAVTQEEILNGLESLISNGGDTQEFLQAIKQKLQARKKIGALDYTYNPKVDELLNVYIIAEAIHSVDSSIFPGAKPVKNRSNSVVEPLPLFDFDNALKRPKKQENLKKIDIQELAAAVSDADIIENIKINPQLFSGKVCQHEVVKKQFNEVFKMEKEFLNFLNSIVSKELPYIKDNFSLKKSQKIFIDKFLKELESCLKAQQKLCARIEDCSPRFPLDGSDGDNQNAKLLFLGIYEEGSLKEQADSFLQLTDYWPKMDALFQERQKQCQKLESQQNLPIIAGEFKYTISARVTQICSRREMISKDIIKSLNFHEFSRQEEIYRRCQAICYVLIRDNLLKGLREDGYVRPKTLPPLLEADFNKNQRYTVAYFLIHPEVEEKLKAFKEAFLSFVISLDENKIRLQFFKEIHDLFNKKPLCLDDFAFLKLYLAVDNPLQLDRGTLTSINQALAANESNAAIKIKGIVTDLIPAVIGVSAHLSARLKQFQQSPDVVDVLLTIPEIKEKVGVNNSLAALDEEAIAKLPSFWRDIFVAEEGALRRFLTQKKRVLASGPDVPDTVVTAITTLTDSGMRIDQFMPMRKFIAQKLLEREIRRQIALLDAAGIFHEDGLVILKSNIYPILESFLTKIEGEHFFLFYYAEALLKIPYVLIKTLGENFTEEMIKNKNIFFYRFPLKVDNTALTLESLTELMLEISQRNKSQFHQAEKTPSVFRVLNLIKEKSDATVYTNLKKEIAALDNKPVESSQKGQTRIVAPTPAGPGKKEPSQDGKPPDDQGLATHPQTPDPTAKDKKPGRNITTPYRTPLAVKASTSLDFKILVIELETVALLKQWQLKKYIRASDGRTTADSANCNFLEAHASKKLLFTAQLSGVNSSVMAYCHEEEVVTATVAAMGKSMQAMAAAATLEIDISASDGKEAQELIQKYVSQTLKQKLFPKVTLNGGALEPNELCQKLDASLVKDYKRIMELQKKVNLSQNTSILLTPAACRTQVQETGGGNQTSRRALFF